MAIWDVDLTTRTGAATAARMGGIAAFVFAALGVLGALVYGLVIMKTNPALAKGATAGGLAEAVVGMIAGFRLCMGKGLIWGGAALCLLALEIIGKAVEARIGGLVFCAAIAVYLVNGLRGAYALRQSRFAEEEADVFG